MVCCMIHWKWNNPEHLKATKQLLGYYLVEHSTNGPSRNFTQIIRQTHFWCEPFAQIPVGLGTMWLISWEKINTKLSWLLKNHRFTHSPSLENVQFKPPVIFSRREILVKPTRDSPKTGTYLWINYMLKQQHSSSKPLLHVASTLIWDSLYSFNLHSHASIVWLLLLKIKITAM